MDYGSLKNNGISVSDRRLAEPSSSSPSPSWGSSISDYDTERQDDGVNEQSKPLLSQRIRVATGVTGDNVNLRILPSVPSIRHYARDSLKGDLVASLTVASLYIPLSFSFANLGHVRPGSSLYAFIFHPIIYALLGSAPLMIVGPEATGSLLVGAAVRGNLASASDSALLCGYVTALAGSMLIAAGTLRLGFIDKILSRPFMHGFISGVGLVLIIEQAIPSLGLENLAKEDGVSDSTALFKLAFLVAYIKDSHVTSALMSSTTLAFILICTSVKRRFGGKYKSMLLFPDRLVAILITAVLTFTLSLASHGLEIVGSVGSSGLGFPSPNWPFEFSLDGLDRLQTMAGTSVLIALLGYFESSVAAKSLRPPGPDNRRAVAGPKADRELVALGVANLVGGCFSTLPAFGGFGRSKLNVQVGGTTRMSSVFLSIISLTCVMFVTPYLYYVPKPTLAAMSMAVGISMMEESHPDITYLVGTKAWSELSLMMAVFLAIFLHSMGLGVVIGFCITLITVIRHSTQSQGQIWCETLVTAEGLRSSSHLPVRTRQFLIVKIGTSLTFANSGSLSTHLKESIAYHEHVDGLIMDFQTTDTLDMCGAQTLKENVEGYTKDGYVVLFCRPTSNDVERTLLNSRILMDTALDVFLGNLDEARSVARTFG